MKSRAKSLRNVLLLSALTLGLWSGYWGVAAFTVNKSIAGLPDVNGAPLSSSVSGFPDRFSVGLQNVALATGRASVWTTPGLTVTAPSYAPTVITANLSQPHRLSGPFGTIAVDSRQTEVAARLKLDWDLPLDSLQLAADGLSLSNERLWAVNIGGVQSALALHADSAAAYQISARIEALDLSDVLNSFPEEYQTIQQVSVNGLVLLDAPLNRFSLGRGLPAPRRLSVQESVFDFGPAQISAAGDLVYDDQNKMTGTLNVTVRNWTALFTLAKQQGLVAPNLESFFLSILTGLAEQDTQKDTLTIPLSIQNNRISYGALNLGILP